MLRSDRVAPTADLINGPTFYNPVAQERVTVSTSITAEPTANLRVSINGFYSRDRLTPGLEFRQMDTRASYRFPFGHKLIADVRLASTGSDQDIRTASGGITYRIPLSLNILSHAEGRVLTGQIYDVETGEGIANTIVSLGRTTGLERISIVELPYAIAADSTILNVLDIGFVRASSAEIDVVYHPSDRANKTSALGKKLKPGPQRGLLVEMTNGKRRVRRVTNSAGRVTFSDLIPGDWAVFIVGSRIPEGYRADPDTLHLSIQAGTRAEREIRIRPANKEIRLVGGTPSLSLGKKTEIPPVQESGIVDSEEKASVNAPVLDGERPSEKSPIHTVVEGELLASIARAEYGLGIYWVRIWLANEDTVADPDLVSPGQVLVLPPRGPLSGAELRTLREYAR